MKLKTSGYSCTSEVTLELISGKWKIPVLSLLASHTRRYNEMQKLIPEITPKVLTIQLRELEASGLIHRKVYAVVPPKVEYMLTELGLQLMPALLQLCDFGTHYLTHIQNQDQQFVQPSKS
ncbi:HxlR family transcriptional regulator [Paenibacillus cellulosilyticus]|uniref:HxlR family transcriptional regulator n=1 Tax=Paenibacillus cellulosilyticus TaxID=375489 RepID=A0A2V2Z065_9BACL|nr:helix-turn-helix domain-containing protein [Paenibacillus cellulosilyticus]PWW07437.1 HxlR family transcriptional regulator [Paenibacillus cellulosilyticus]QKS44403.1 helix-turn-helix transcriptional regulator [Paenibacillus cellulosilyticus]